MARGIEVDYYELGVRDGTSVVLSADLSTIHATREIIVNWDDAEDAMAQALGFSWVDSSGNLKRWLPDCLPSRPWLYCTAVTRCMGIGWRTNDEYDDGDSSGYEKCQLSLEYTRPPYDILADDEVELGEWERFTEVNGELNAEYLTVPAIGALKWSQGNSGSGGIGTAFPGNVGKITPSIVYKYKWMQIPEENLPLAAIAATVGKVNNAEFDGVAAGEYLMIGAGWQRVFMADKGTSAFNVEYALSWRPTGWNKFFNFRDSTPAWYQVSIDGTYYNPTTPPAAGKLVYDNADFTNLFTPEV